MSPQQFPAERRRFGFSRALVQLAKRRHIPLIGYVILALAVGWQFEIERSNASKARTQIEQVLHDNCNRGNKLRGVLQGLIAQEIPQVERAVAKGQLTKAEAAQFNIQIAQNEAAVGPINCKVVTLK